MEVGAGSLGSYFGSATVFTSTSLFRSDATQFYEGGVGRLRHIQLLLRRVAASRSKWRLRSFLLEAQTGDSCKRRPIELIGIAPLPTPLVLLLVQLTHPLIPHLYLLLPLQIPHCLRILLLPLLLILFFLLPQVLSNNFVNLVIRGVRSLLGLDVVFQMERLV